MDEQNFPPRFSIDTPAFLQLDDSGKISVFGWCLLGKGIQPIKASIRINDLEMVVIDFNHSRPDVLECFRDYDVNDNVGFHTLLDVPQGTKFKISVMSEGADGQKYSFSKDIWIMPKDAGSENKNLANKLKKTGHLIDYPIQSFIEVTTKCNLYCITCYGRDKRELKHMDRKTFTGLLGFLSNVQIIHLYGMGEPTIHPDYLWMFESVRSVNPTAMISFCSNFNDIDGALMAALVGDAPSGISISLDAATKDTYEKIKRKGNWDNVMDNIRRLQELKSVANSRYPLISFSFVVQKYNIEEIADFVRLVNKMMNPESIAFTHIDHYPQWEINYDKHSDKIKEAFNELKKHNNNAWGSEYMLMKREFGQKGVNSGVSEQVNEKPECYEPFQTIVIDVDGSVRTCPSNTSRFGNVAQEEVADIWNGYRYNLFRQMMLDGPLHPECIECIKNCINQPKIR